MLLGITMLKANENAVSFSIPTDLQLEGISQPVEKIIETSRSAYPMTRTKNFSDKGMLTTIVQRSEAQDSVVKVVYDPYRENARSIREYSGNNDQYVDELIMSDLLSDTEFANVLNQVWRDPLTTVLSYNGGETTTYYNSDLTISQLRVFFGSQEMNTKMVFLQSESELEGVTLEEETIYVVILKKDDYGNWTELVSITPNSIDPTVKNRSFSKREIFYRQ